MPADAPLISVIVPAWNSELRLRTLLEGLAAQTIDPSRHQVLVVDNGSNDATAAVAASFPFVEVLSEPRPGSYRARNRAIAAARGEYLLFTDADCIPAANWLEQAAAQIKKLPGVSVHAGRIRLFREPGAQPFSARYEELFAFNQEKNVAAGFSVTANMLCRADCLRALGGFNDELFSGGDVDLSRRLVSAGHVLVYASEMTVAHPTRGSLRALIHKRRRVIGGGWQRGFWRGRGIFRTAKSVLGGGWYEWRSIAGSTLEWWAKPGVMMVSLVLMMSAQVELLRLRAGRPPYRS